MGMTPKQLQIVPSVTPQAKGTGGLYMETANIGMVIMGVGTIFFTWISFKLLFDRERLQKKIKQLTAERC